MWGGRGGLEVVCFVCKSLYRCACVVPCKPFSKPDINMVGRFGEISTWQSTASLRIAKELFHAKKYKANARLLSFAGSDS